MEIMKLIPTGKDYLWGGTRLRDEYGKKIDMTHLVESWECSVHPDGSSFVENGQHKGKKLKEVLEAHPEYIGTKANGVFPILAKFIDAKKDLSVQVHPDDEYALEHENDNGKTEMWYIIDADEGARLIYGFKHKVLKEILEQAIEKGELDKHLQKVEVHKGDLYFVPAGTVHGIGKGILLAEKQESFNVTYRVYDYDRVDKNGKKRQLHFDKAVQVMDMGVVPDIKPKRGWLSTTLGVLGNFFADASILKLSESRLQRVFLSRSWKIRFRYSCAWMDMDKSKWMEISRLGSLKEKQFFC